MVAEDEEATEDEVDPVSMRIPPVPPVPALEDMATEEDAVRPPAPPPVVAVPDVDAVGAKMLHAEKGRIDAIA